MRVSPTCRGFHGQVHSHTNGMLLFLNRRTDCYRNFHSGGLALIL